MEPELPKTPASNIDISAILLPKKEPPGATPASAQRVNAGLLFEQAEKAKQELPKEKSGATSGDSPEGGPPRTFPEGVSAKATEPSIVQPLETYKGDIEKAVQGQHVSVVSIAAAEAVRRGDAADNAEAETLSAANEQSKSFLFKTIMETLGVGLVLGAAAILAYAYIYNRAAVPIAAAPVAPFILVDATTIVPVIVGQTTTAPLMQSLVAAKNAVHLSAGLVEQLNPVAQASATSTDGTLMDAQTFLNLFVPNIPPDLLRTIQPSFLLGVHSFSNNQPFIILSTDSYETAFAGMLAWEPTMQQDFSPLFNYTPAPHIPEQNSATTTASAATTASPGGFVDQVVENHDARVITNSTGDILFLWTFLDRSTIVITTNEYTLREIISRLKVAPTTQ
jgi:hypothetical protein